jgi:hypothetical protein
VGRARCAVFAAIPKDVGRSIHPDAEASDVKFVSQHCRSHVVPGISPHIAACSLLVLTPSEPSLSSLGAEAARRFSLGTVRVCLRRNSVCPTPRCGLRFRRVGSTSWAEATDATSGWAPQTRRRAQ